ncbi:MAG: hypothetical protein R3Y56_07300 [Akkermansia sp.]
MSQPNVEDILRLALGKFEGDETTQFQHGDWYTNPHPYDTYEHDEGLKEWMLGLQSETAENCEDDLQGWTYVADYTIHPMTPYKTAGTGGPFYIHARINDENKLEFGIFTSKAKASNAKPMKCALGRVSEESYHKYVHGDQQAPTLRIAGKEESEKMLLKGGKLIKSACPKFAGCFMYMGGTILQLTIKTTRITKDEDGKILDQEEITDAPWFKQIQLYGHLWTYWSSIIDNTLYFVGIPLYNGNESGTCVFTQREERTIDRTKEPAETTNTYQHIRQPVNLPPTEDDLKSYFLSNGWILQDYSSTPSCPLYNILRQYFGLDERGYFSTRNFNVSSWFNSNCDTSAKTTLCSRVIANIKDGVLTQCHHGDINARLTAWSSKGGVFAEAGSITVANQYEHPSQNASEENNEENKLYNIWRIGQSGYVLCQYPYDRIGTVRISAQCFSTSHRGYTYNIAALGATTPPHSCYPGSTLSNYTCLEGEFIDITIVKKDEDDSDKEPSEPGAGADVVEEESIEEPPEGLLAEYYDYQLGADSDDYPIKITMTPNMIDLRSYFEVNKCYSKDETDALASTVSYDFTLNENSKYLKTPSYSYTVDIEAEGQDGPFEAKKGEESLGQRTIVVGGLTSTKTDKSITATVSFATNSGGSGSTKTTSQTITRSSQKEDWRLVGQSVCTPMDKLEVPASAKYLKITSGGTYTFKIPEKVYLINWTETWEEEEKETDPDTGEETTRRVVHNKKIQRYYYTEQERDSTYDSLINDGPWDTTEGVAHELVGKPTKRNQAGKAYIKVHEKNISVSLFQMQDTMLWLDTATAEESGSLTITASSGTFTATTSTSSVTQTNP